MFFITNSKRVRIFAAMSTTIAQYTKENIHTLDWNVHVRLRPGVYIGKVGDGSTPDDGLYVLIKEVIDNARDEFGEGYGHTILVDIDNNQVSVRDFGRGIPLEKVIDCAAKMNTGGKFNSDVFQQSVGLNGMGLKAVNAMSTEFYIESFRNGESYHGRFEKGVLQEEGGGATTGKNGTLVRFTPDPELFVGYTIQPHFVEQMIKHYAYLNVGLKLKWNGVDYVSKDGLLDLLNDTISEPPLYPPIHLTGKDIEIVLTHADQNGENISSFANGQNTSQGGTHLSAYREAVARTIKEFYKKDFDPSDIRQGIVGAVSVRLKEPKFANQTKTILDSKDMGDSGVTLRNFVGDFIKEHLDNYLHKHPETADVLLKKILHSEKERKEVAGIRKKARENAKKVSLNNSKLRDCRIHLTDKNEKANRSTIFITEGDSASGSITTSRDPQTQAVFSLKGKPENTYGRSKKIVYENEEFNLLMAALNVDEDLDNLRYNKVVIATDADPDGMHIRLLLLGFFLRFYPDLIRRDHIYILQTPLFRVRNKKETRYCYTDLERERAIKELGPHPEITRFKGLGEISPKEFGLFIGENIRLDKVSIDKEDHINELLEFYLGENTPERRAFIENNLRMVEE